MQRSKIEPQKDDLAPILADDLKTLAATDRLSSAAASKVATKVVGDIAKAFSLSDFQAGKVARLRIFGGSVGVAPDKLNQAIQDRAAILFREWARNLVGGGHVGTGEIQKMREAGSALGLEENTQNQLYYEVAQAAVVGLVETAVSTDLISPEQDASLARAIADLNVTANISGDLGTKLAHARTHWSIANGSLPTIEVPLSLQRGEVAHTMASATSYQTATRTKSISYGGPALRVRIAKGVYYRTGHYKVHRSTAEYSKSLGHGPLVVTNKRLLFINAKWTTSARLDSILHIEPYKDALAVIRSSGKPTTYRFDQADEWFCAILARAIHDATAP